MAGSGVYRLRLAKSKGGYNARMKNPSSGKGNDVVPDVNVGSDLDPGPNPMSKKFIFQDFPTTPPPLSDEHGGRGEANVRNSRRANKHS